MSFPNLDLTTINTRTIKEDVLKTIFIEIEKQQGNVIVDKTFKIVTKRIYSGFDPYDRDPGQEVFDSITYQINKKTC